MTETSTSGAAGAMPATGAMPGAASTQTAQAGADGATPEAGATPEPQALPEFNTWLADQDETTRKLIGERFATLEGTLSTEREARKTLSKELKALGDKLEANSEAAQQLAKIQSSMEAERKRADFYEQATVAGCVKPKLAYLVAESEKLTMDQIKTQYPELFASARSASTHAGSGTGAQPPRSFTLNDLVRGKT